MAKLKPIPSTRAERRREKLLFAIARAHSERYHETSPAPLIGGTALKHVLGVSRPTTDLDYAKDKASRRIAVDEIVPILHDLGYRTRRVAEDRTAPRWTIEYKKGWFGRWEELKIDEPTQAGHVREPPRLVNGVTTYSERGLVQSKMQAILYPRQGITRIKARDLYDCAWLAEQRPELLSDAQIRGLTKLVNRLAEQHRVRAQWEAAFRTDPVMKRISLSEVANVLREGLQRETARRGLKESEATEKQGKPTLGPTATASRKIPASTTKNSRRRRRDSDGYGC